MRLKKVRITGFKTFADKTEFDVDGDLIAVVGPNGCGKSNIVDAIMWGLGEPNPRHLRAANSQEIIFNGSARRKPLGFAEVSLLFDNEDGALGIDAPDVVITRRVHRNGDSEFEINRQRCRLKDIYDLLADSGLGRSGYAIVGQQEIDSALAASPLDRRAWIDEAAGVQRYRAKREESLRRLGQAADHLARVQDILTEIEVNREPLREEAETAIRYKAAVANLREFELGILAKEVADTSEAIGQAEARAATAHTTSEAEAKDAETLEADAKKIGEDISEQERHMDALRELAQSALSAREKADSELRLLEQRLRNLDELRESLTANQSIDEDRAQELKNQLESLRSEEESLQGEIETVSEALSSENARRAQLEVELAEATAALEAARDGHAAMVAWEADTKMRHQRRTLIQKELAGIESTLPSLQEAIAEAEGAEAEAQGELDALRGAREALEEQAKKHSADKESLAARVRAVMQRVAELEGKRRGLESTIEAHEGLGQGARAVMSAVGQGILPDHFTPVAEAIDVESDLAVALETALGASANDLICDQEHQAKEAIQWLKQNRLGRATFQPISLMRPAVVRDDLRRHSREKGIVGIASELVECDRRFRPVIDSLLSRVLIAETLDDCLRLARTQGWSRMVSLDGEVVHSSGAVTGGNAARQTQGLLQRKAELADVEADLAKLQKELEALRSQVAKAESGPNPTSTWDPQKFKEAEVAYQDAHRWTLNLKSELNQTERSMVRLKEDLTALGTVLAKPDITGDANALEQKRNELLQEIAAHDAQTGGARERLARSTEQFATVKQRRTDVERLLAGESTSESARAARLVEIEEEKRAIAQELESGKVHKADAEARHAEHNDALQKTAEEKRRLLDASYAIAERLKQARANVETLRESIRLAELDRVRQEGRRAAAEQRLLEDFGIDEAAALEIAKTVEIPEGATQTVNQLRREIKSMGEVNLGAIEAYSRLTERYDELNNQREDIVGAKEEIEAGIAELDKLTRDRFEKTFEAVRQEFQTTFTTLFGGGEGELRIVDPTELLDSGVDIEVTVPGKKRQRLELLSGGERALAASAFLFALLRVKPSPLVVLDEVDAPMDGRNVERFIQALKMFYGKTQFICITHNPLTIESAPIWYGVTMQEPGVTTVIPYRNVPADTAPQPVGAHMVP